MLICLLLVVCCRVLFIRLVAVEAFGSKKALHRNKPIGDRLLATTGGLLMTVCCLMLLSACSQTQEEKRQTFTQDDVAIIVARDVEILYSDSAVVRVRVTGPLLHNFDDRENPRQEFPNGVKIEFLEPNLSVKSTITAKTAFRYQDKGQVTARDSVILVTAQQEKLETEELTWDEKTGKVFTEKFVKVTKPGEVIYGFGLEAEQDFSYWKIKVPKGRIKVEQLDEVLK